MLPLFGRCYPVISCIFLEKIKTSIHTRIAFTTNNWTCKSANLLVLEYAKVKNCRYLNVQKWKLVGIWICKSDKLLVSECAKVKTCWYLNMRKWQIVGIWKCKSANLLEFEYAKVTNCWYLNIAKVINCWYIWVCISVKLFASECEKLPNCCCLSDTSNVALSRFFYIISSLSVR